MMHTNNKPRKTVVLQFPFKLGIANMRSLFKTNKVREHIMKKHLIAVVAAGIFSTNVFAVQPYIQAQVGQSKIDPGYSVSDDKDTYLGFGVGFGVNENLAFEVGYKDFGEAKDKYVCTDGFTRTNCTDSVEATAISFAAVGILPLGSSAKVFAKLGLDMWKGKAKFEADGYGSDSEDDDGTDLFYSVGAAFDVTSSTDIHIEYQKHSFDVADSDLDVDVLAVGVNFGF